MRKISKMICGLLTITILLSFLGTATFAEDISEDAEFLKAVSLLGYVGVISDDVEIDKVDMDKAVTRADFAVYLADLLDLPDVEEGTLYYNDLPRTHYAFQAVTALTMSGYLLGTGDKRFEPDEEIIKNDAEMVLIKALGLVGYINSGDAHPSFISRVKREADLKHGVSTSTHITFRDMMVMLYNTLTADYYQPGVFTNDTTQYRINGDTLLYATRKVRLARHQLMTATNGADIYGINVYENSMKIGNADYLTGGADYRGLLGRYVDFAYEEETKTVVWAYRSSDKAELQIFFDEHCNYNPQERTIEYITENGRVRTAQLTASVTVIYNGRYVGTNITEILSKPRYDITLLSSDENTVYDIAVVEAYENILVGSKFDKEKIVYDKFSGKQLTLDENEYDILKIENTSGSPMTYDEIQENDVLSVFVSKDGKIATIVVNNSIVSGRVEKIDGEKNLVIGGDLYKLYAPELINDIILGAETTGFLDCKGYIVKFDSSFATSKNQFVGYAVKGAVDGIFGGTLRLIILSENGDMTTYEIDNKLNIDGTSYKDMFQAFAQLSLGGAFEPQLLLCTTDESGNIKRVDKAYHDDGNPHLLTISKEVPSDVESWQANYRTNQNKVGLKMLTNSKTKVFYIPDGYKELEECRVGNMIVLGDYRGAISYRTNSDTFYEQYIVVKQPQYTTIDVNTAIVMFNQFYDCLNDDGEIVRVMEYNNGTSMGQCEINKNMNTDIHNLKRGDAIKIGVDAQNTVNQLEVIFRADSNASLNINDNTLKSPDNDGRVISCYANDKQGYALKTGWETPNSFDEIFQLNDSIPIMVYDSEDDEVYSGSMEDILTYKAVGNSASTLIIQSARSRLITVLVYN